MTPVDHGEVCLNYDQAWFAERGPRAAEVARRPDAARVRRPPRRREPGDLDARARVHARDDRALRRGSLAGVLGGAARERRPRRRRLGGGVQRPLLGRVGEQRRPADRRLVRVEPAGRGHLPEPAPGGGADGRRRGQLLPPGRVRRASCAARPTRTARAQLVDFMLSTRFQEDVPLSMFVFPVDPLAAAPAGVRAVRRRPASPLSAPAGRDRREPRAVDQGVDGDRPALSGTGWRALTRRRPARLPRALLRVPARDDPRARAPRRRAASRRRSTCSPTR